MQLECTAKPATVEAVVRNRGHALRNFKRAGKIETAQKALSPIAFSFFGQTQSAVQIAAIMERTEADYFDTIGKDEFASEAATGKTPS